MRRNLGNELIVALLAAVSLLFAAVFAVLLSISTSQRATETPAESAVASLTPIVTATPLPTRTTDAALATDMVGTQTQVAPTDAALPEATLTAARTDRETAAAATVTITMTTASAETLSAPPATMQTAEDIADTEAPPAEVSPAVTAFATPLHPEAPVTATPAETRPEIAPANVTLTAIRATLVERRELAATRPSPMSSPTEVAVTVPPSATATDTQLPTVDIASATPEIAPANVTLTAIRAELDEGQELAATSSSATTSPTEISATATPRATATDAQLPTVDSATATPEIAATTTPRATAADTQLPTVDIATATPRIVPANLTLTAIRATLVERRELAATRPSPMSSPTEIAGTATSSATATETELPTVDIATATPRIAPANVTLTAIRATLVERRELAATRPSPTSIPTEIAATATPSAAATETELPTVDIATATPRIAPANLTLTAIRTTLDERRELIATSPSATSSPTEISATATPGATAADTQLPTVDIATATPRIAPANLTLTAIRAELDERRELAATSLTEFAATTSSATATDTQSLTVEILASATPRIAPANMTLTAIRAELDERRGLAATSPSMTASPTEFAPANVTLTAIRAELDERRDLAATIPSMTVSPTEIAVATATPRATAADTQPPTVDMATATPRIAPANLTLAAIRAELDERRELPAASPSPTSIPTEISATTTPRATAADTQLPTLDTASATREIAPANITLTAIRAELDERRELPAVSPSPTSSPTEISSTATPSASATETQLPTLDTASATREIAPANMTLTAIRAELDERRELPAVSPSSTSSPTEISTTATPRATATETQSPTVDTATATPRIAPANVTLTAIRTTLDERRELAATRPSPTSIPTEIAATATPSAAATETELPTVDIATATPRIAPANVTLTAIRTTLDERRELAATRPSPMSSPTEIAGTATSSATATETELPTVGIATANLTLTAIRAELDERRELAATSPSATASPTEIAMMATSSVTATETELPTVDIASATPEIAPANLTLTAIRAEFDDRRELAATSPSPTSSPTEISSTATPSASATETQSPTLDTASATREIVPANMTLTAIRAELDERRELAATSPSATATPTEIAATATSSATATETEPPTVDIASATPEIVQANLTLTAIRAELDERRELAATRPSLTSSPTKISTTATPRATATATPRIAPANVTLTAIRAELDERRGLAATSPSMTASPTEIAATTSSATTTETRPPTVEVLASETPIPPEVREIARPEIAPANLTLTAIHAELDERRELAATSLTEFAATTSSATTTETQPPTVDIASATPEIAPANLTLTAIRATLDERRELPAASPSSTSSPTEIAAPATPSATTTETQPPTVDIASATPEIAPANLTLTAIRATLDERRELPAASPSSTSSPTEISTTATPRATATETQSPTVDTATATPRIAPANVTLAAIRAELDERRGLAATSPSMTASPTEIAATVTPGATAIETQPPTVEVLASATPEIAPANLTLAAIRATLDERRESAATSPSPTSSPTEIPTTATPRATAADTRLPTVDMATATPRIVPANLTLTAIRAELDERRELAATRPSLTSSPTEISSTTSSATATETEPPTVDMATATPKIGPTNLTLTAIRAELDERRELPAASPSPIASPTEIAATATSRATATDTQSPTLDTASATPEIAPANLTLTAIRAMLDERRELAATSPSPTSSPTDALATAVPAISPTEAGSPTKAVLAPTISPTPTPLPFYFAYLIPTPTVYRSAENGFRIDCQVAEDWIPYEVRDGDSMLSLALSSGISLVEFREGNCFEPIRGILAGEIVLLPQLPDLSMSVPAPEFSLGDAAGATVGCDGRLARIVSPAPLEFVDDVFALVGSALLPEGGRYHIALKPRWSEEYYLYLVSDQAVRNNVLGLINSEIFGAGAHRIQLTVFDIDGELIKGGICDIPVIFGSP